MRCLSIASLILMAIALSGCPRDTTPPMLTVNTIDCVAAPDLSSAHQVTLKAETQAKVIFDANTPCLQPAGSGSRLYAVFRLPEATEPFWISVTSVPKGLGVVAPYLVLLDEIGSPTREIAHDRFMSRGGSLQVGIRPQASERYLLVASHPDSVGHQSSDIVGSVQQTMVPVGTGFVMVASGEESIRNLTRAHGGTIIVSAELLPQAPKPSSSHPSMAPLR